MRRVALLVLALTASSCFGDDDGDPNNYVAIDQVEAAYKKAYCSYAVRCGYFPDPGSCAAAALSSTGLGFYFDFDPNVVAAVHAGRVFYQGSNVKICLDSLANQTCDKSDKDGRLQLVACLDIFRGSLDANMACTIDQECISMACSGNSTTACTQGVCIGSTAPSYNPAALGQPCTSGRGCVDGAYCDLITDICTVFKASGEPCTSNNECAYGLMCLENLTTQASTCRAAPTLGQPCPEFVCRDDGQFCDSTTMTCKAYGLPPMTCTSSSQCSTYYPCNFTTSQCTKGPTLGMSCSTSTRCFDEGTYCNTLTATCESLKADGMSCNSALECQSGNCDTSQSIPVCTTPTTCF